MQKNINKHYTISFSDDRAEIKYSGYTRLEKLNSAIVFAFMFFPFAVFSILLFLKSVYILSVMFALVSLFVLYLKITGCIYEQKKKRFCCLILNDVGLLCRELTFTTLRVKEYEMSWNDVSTWGLVNNNRISLPVRTNNVEMQICLYFSRTLRNEEYLRKAFDGVESRLRNRYSSNDLIAMGFGENQIDETVCTVLNDFVSKHAEKCKQHSFYKIV